MVAYADTVNCLRWTILQYFGDPAASALCGSCSSCARLKPIDDDDCLLVRKILSGVARAGERYGRRRVAAMLSGQLEDLPEPLTRLSTTGLLRDEPLVTIERWIDALGAAGLLRSSDDKYRTLSLTPLGREVMAGRVRDVLIAAPGTRSAASTRGTRRRVRKRLGEPSIDVSVPPTSVVDALRAWRLDQARRNAIAPFVILHDRTLMAIASHLPRSAQELSEIPGIGPAKLAAYGEAILNIVKGSG
jgi:ATP-dependent DNA helicase RecQ